MIVESGNEYGSVLVVSLDDEPIRRSRRLLVQVATEEKPHGFATKGDRITALGSGPMLMRDVEATVTIAGGKRLTRVRTLDPAFRSRDRPRSKVVGRDRRVTLPRDASFVLLEAR